MTSSRALHQPNDLAANLRTRPGNPYALGGVGPLIAGLVLVLLVVLLLPSIARERNVSDTAPTAPAVTTTTPVAP